MGTRKQVGESILVSAKVYLFIFFTNSIYCNIFSKSLKGSFIELSLFTFEYLKDTNARQDRTHTDNGCFEGGEKKANVSVTYPN